MELENFPQRFAFIIKSVSGSKTKFADEVGKTPGQITDICKGRSKPTFDFMGQLLQKYAVNVNWLLSGQGQAFIKDEFSVAAPSVPHTPLTTLPNNAHQEDFVWVPRYDIKASLGTGMDISHESVIGHLAFQSQWVYQDLRVDPIHLVVISAEGDSMEPTIRSGDLLLIDLAQTRLKKDAIFVIRLEDGLMAKRIQWMVDGSVVIRSDNPVYKEQVVSSSDTKQFEIIGKVIWIGRKI